MRQKLADTIDGKTEGTGSLMPGESGFLAVGKLRRPHGLNGEMVMDVLTDFPERMKHGKVVYVGDEHKLFHIKSTREHGRSLLISFEEASNVDEVAQLRNTLVFVNSKTLPELGKGEYYFHQIVNLKVIDQAGQTLGYVSEILETGANDVYVVKTPENKEILLPVIDSVVLEINLAEKVVVVNPPKWW